MFVRDKECMKDTPVIHGRPDKPIYGKDNKKCLDDFVGSTKSCVCRKDKSALRSILTGVFPAREVYVKNWKYPVGAFHGAEGGPC